jgi:hypothetical protein
VGVHGGRTTRLSGRAHSLRRAVVRGGVPRDVSIRVGGDGVLLSRRQGVYAGPRQRSVAAVGRGDRSGTALADR